MVALRIWDKDRRKSFIRLQFTTNRTYMCWSAHQEARHRASKCLIALCSDLSKASVVGIRVSKVEVLDAVPAAAAHPTSECRSYHQADNGKYTKLVRLLLCLPGELSKIEEPKTQHFVAIV